MAVFGIEFTSGFAQILYTLVLVLIGASAVWLFWRLRQNEQLLVSVRRENSKLRHEVANVTGWTSNGRLPADWQERLRAETASAADYQNLLGLEKSREPMLLAAHQALAGVQPPVFASGESSEEVGRAHARITELIDALAGEQLDPLPALANGDFDKLFCFWRRLEAYFPDHPETDAYGVAGHAVIDLLRRNDVNIFAPRPLSVESAKNCVFTTEDGERLRDIARIRTMAFTASNRFTTPQRGEELVIDCERPGWSGPNGQKNARILILDRSW